MKHLSRLAACLLALTLTACTAAETAVPAATAPPTAAPSPTEAPTAAPQATPLPYDDLSYVPEFGFQQKQTYQPGEYNRLYLDTYSFNDRTVLVGAEDETAALLEAGRDPGLGVRSLQARGITGQGVKIAIIDQSLLTDHPEISGAIAAYCETGIDSGLNEGTLHGPAVASILAGQTVGVAPGVQVYYMATPGAADTPPTPTDSAEPPAADGQTTKKPAASPKKPRAKKNTKTTKTTKTAKPKTPKAAKTAKKAPADETPELCATRTIKISRADLEQAMAAQQAAKQQEQPNPEPPAAPQPEPLPEPEPEPPANLPKPKASILDDDIPDFSAGLDPAALEAARKADEKAPPRSTDEFQRAASQLFEDDEDDGEDEEPTITFPGRSKAKPAVPRPLAAKQEPKQDAIHNRSLAMIERAERRHRRKAIAAVAIIALLVLVGAAVLLGLTRGCTVKAPAYKNYGTEQFDTQAQAYLKSAAAENEKIIGYLAFPGQNGQLVYSGSQPGDGAAISGTNYLNASMPSNTVLSCADASLASLTDQTNFSQNAEFTLYLSDVTYHFRAVAVYNTDAAGTENAFTPASYGELSDYYSYAEFSQSIKERSLFDTGNTPGDKETFLTLMSTGGTNGTFVCVTAVLLPDQAQ